MLSNDFLMPKEDQEWEPFPQPRILWVEFHFIALYRKYQFLINVQLCLWKSLLDDKGTSISLYVGTKFRESIFRCGTQCLLLYTIYRQASQTTTKMQTWLKTDGIKSLSLMLILSITDPLESVSGLGLVLKSIVEVTNCSVS